MEHKQTTIGKVYLLPCPIGESIRVISPSVREPLRRLRFFIVERTRTTRRYLRQLSREMDLDTLTFYEMDKHGAEVNPTFLDPCFQGYDIGLLSEAGMPCVADPGYRYVALAHKLGIEVCPYAGPNSILLALISSGFSGQHFEFHGYLSRQKTVLHKQLLALQADARKNKKTQIFIEAPYRNGFLLDQMGASLHQHTEVVIAIALQSSDQKIIRLTVKDLHTIDRTWIHKKPAVFLMA